MRRLPGSRRVFPSEPDGRARGYLHGRILVDCTRSAVAEPLVRTLATRLTGCDPGPLHHRCPFCGSVEHGQPYVDAPVHVGVAHAAGLTAVAVSVAGPVGIDLEADAEIAWVRREAVGKALGVGIATDDDPECVWQTEVTVLGHVAVVALVTEKAARAATERAARRRTAH